MRYPDIANADEILGQICEKNLKEKYLPGEMSIAEGRMEYELLTICNQGSASGYLTVYNVLNSIEASDIDYGFAGTVGASLIAYLLGFTKVDPLNAKFKLYPEFHFGLEGEKEPDFEALVTPELHNKILHYFRNYPGDEKISYSCFKNGNVFGVFIGGDEEKRYVGYHDNSTRDIFSFCFIPVEKASVCNAITQGEAFETLNPASFEEHVKCYGLEHSTGAWRGNADIILNGKIATFEEVIAYREDVYEFLMRHGIDKQVAYGIADMLRLGRIKRNGWDPVMMDSIRKTDVPGWYIESCEKIETLFPRAHGMMLFSIFDQ